MDTTPKHEALSAAPDGHSKPSQEDQARLKTFRGFISVCPFREPAWRLVRARFLLKEGQPFSEEVDDAATGRVLHYLEELKSCETEAQRQGLAERMPDIHQAHQIHEQNEPLRWVLEALLLTGQTSEEIGRRLGLPAAVVDCYEQIFFNVRDYLSASDWIIRMAVGMTPFQGCRENDIDVILKWFAFAGGPLVLEACLRQDAMRGTGWKSRFSWNQTIRASTRIQRGIRLTFDGRER